MSWQPLVQSWNASQSESAAQAANAWLHGPPLAHSKQLAQSPLSLQLPPTPELDEDALDDEALDDDEVEAPAPPAPSPPDPAAARSRSTATLPPHAPAVAMATRKRRLAAGARRKDTHRAYRLVHVAQRQAPAARAAAQRQLDKLNTWTLLPSLASATVP